MKLEISIRASNRLKQPLLEELADRIPDGGSATKSIQLGPDHFNLNFLVNTGVPDDVLRIIAEAVAKTEDNYAQTHSVEVHIRNTEGSEQPLDTGQNAKYFFPVDGFRIVPWNRRNKSSAADNDIILDAGHAFGTGLHPSTRLCLQLLKHVADRNPAMSRKPCSVLDIGCGSGILTIAALRLGADRALGIEIDQQAVQTARRNVEINGYEHLAVISNISWQNISEYYDLILANLVPSVLFKAIPHMAKILKKRGLLITSGFQAAKNAEISEMFHKNGLHLLKASSCNGWGALLLMNPL